LHRETTLIDSHDFEAARRRAQPLFLRWTEEDLATDDGPPPRVLKLSELRAQGIW
jgi:hypothetical protein